MVFPTSQCAVVIYSAFTEGNYLYQPKAVWESLYLQGSGKYEVRAFKKAKEKCLIGRMSIYVRHQRIVFNKCTKRSKIITNQKISLIICSFSLSSCIPVSIPKFGISVPETNDVFFCMKNILAMNRYSGHDTNLQPWFHF